MGIFDFLFGNRKKAVKEYIDKGAVIMDVRTEREYKAGAIKHAVHIPLDQLKPRLGKIKQLNKPVIAYCASGMRSAQAVKILNSEDIDAINGGGMQNLKRLL